MHTARENNRGREGNLQMQTWALWMAALPWWGRVAMTPVWLLAIFAVMQASVCVFLWDELNRLSNRTVNPIEWENG